MCAPSQATSFLPFDASIYFALLVAALSSSQAVNFTALKARNRTDFTVSRDFRSTLFVPTSYIYNNSEWKTQEKYPFHRPFSIKFAVFLNRRPFFVRSSGIFFVTHQRGRMGEEEANDVATVNYCSTSTAKSRRFVQNPQRNGEKYGSHYCFCNIKAVPTTFSNVVQCTFAFRGYFSSKSPVEPPEATPTQPISISFCKRTNYLFNVHRSIVTFTTIDGPMNYLFTLSTPIHS